MRTVICLPLFYSSPTFLFQQLTKEMLLFPSQAAQASMTRFIVMMTHFFAGQSNIQLPILLFISASSSIAAQAVRKRVFNGKLQDQIFLWLQLWRETRHALSGELMQFCFGICYFLGVLLSAHASLFFSTGLCAAKKCDATQRERSISFSQ